MGDGKSEAIESVNGDHMCEYPNGRPRTALNGSGAARPSNWGPVMVAELRVITMARSCRAQCEARA